MQCVNKQTGQYIVAINSSGHCSSGSATVVVHLCPYNMEPLYQVTEPGIQISSQVKDEEVVSIRNIFSVSEATNSQICVKFHWQGFERIRRFVWPENTSNGLSCQAFQDELFKLAHEACVRKQHVVSDQVEYASLFSNGARERTIKFFKMPFLVTDKSLFTSGSHSRYFDLNRTTTLLSIANWDKVLYKTYAKEGTLEFCDNCFRALTPGQELRNNIIDLFLKWRVIKVSTYCLYFLTLPLKTKHLSGLREL